MRSKIRSGFGLGVLLGVALSVAARASDEHIPDTAGAAQNCLSARQVQSFEVLSDQMVLLRGAFDRYWLNRMPVRCVGLRKDMLVTMDRRSSQLCAHDMFRAQERSDLLPDMGPNCRLGQFEPVTAEQVAVLKQSLRED